MLDIEFTKFLKEWEKSPNTKHCILQLLPLSYGVLWLCDVCVTSATCPGLLVLWLCADCITNKDWDLFLFLFFHLVNNLFCTWLEIFGRHVYLLPAFAFHFLEQMFLWTVHREESSYSACIQCDTWEGVASLSSSALQGHRRRGQIAEWTLGTQSLNIKASWIESSGTCDAS